MCLRWRKDGRLLCGAKTKAEEGDCFIGDRLHYQLAEECAAIVPDKDEHKNGLWHWIERDPVETQNRFDLEESKDV